jgi:general secretion pathway protein M
MKLARREKFFVSAAVLFIAIFFLFQFLIFPFFTAKRKIQKGVRAKENALKEMVVLVSEFKRYKNDSQGIKKVLGHRKRGFTLFSFLEKAAGEADVKEHIKYMKPSTSVGPDPYKESLVEIKLELVTLKQIIDYLYKIESTDNVVIVKRFSANENKKRNGYLDAILQVLTFE